MTISTLMDWTPSESPRLGERIDLLWKRGVRFVVRVSCAFALSTTAAIGIGVAIADNALVQILVTVLIALAFWIPSFFIVLRFDQWLSRPSGQRGSASVGASPSTDPHDDDVWRRLFAVAPRESQRLAAIRRSLGKSRQSLGRAELDPDAHDLCILIDRRLPELIAHELEDLPPDDRNRREKVGELINLIEQFARHCSRRSSNEGVGAGFEAEVLRRRFEARLTEF